MSSERPPRRRLARRKRGGVGCSTLRRLAGLGEVPLPVSTQVASTQQGFRVGKKNEEDLHQTRGVLRYRGTPFTAFSQVGID